MRSLLLLLFVLICGFISFTLIGEVPPTIAATNPPWEWQSQCVGCYDDFDVSHNSLQIGSDGIDRYAFSGTHLYFGINNDAGSELEVVDETETLGLQFKLDGNNQARIVYHTETALKLAIQAPDGWNIFTLAEYESYTYLAINYQFDWISNNEGFIYFSEEDSGTNFTHISANGTLTTQQIATDNVFFDDDEEIYRKATIDDFGSFHIFWIENTKLNQLIWDGVNWQLSQSEELLNFESARVTYVEVGQFDTVYLTIEDYSSDEYDNRYYTLTYLNIVDGSIVTQKELYYWDELSADYHFESYWVLDIKVESQNEVDILINHFVSHYDHGCIGYIEYEYITAEILANETTTQIAHLEGIEDVRVAFTFSDNGELKLAFLQSEKFYFVDNDGEFEYLFSSKRIEGVGKVYLKTKPWKSLHPITSHREKNSIFTIAKADFNQQQWQTAHNFDIESNTRIKFTEFDSMGNVHSFRGLGGRCRWSTDTLVYEWEYDNGEQFSEHFFFENLEYSDPFPQYFRPYFDDVGNAHMFFYDHYQDQSFYQLNENGQLNSPVELPLALSFALNKEYQQNAFLEGKMYVASRNLDQVVFSELPNDLEIVTSGFSFDVQWLFLDENGKPHIFYNSIYNDKNLYLAIKENSGWEISTPFNEAQVLRIVSDEFTNRDGETFFWLYQSIGEQYIYELYRWDGTTMHFEFSVPTTGVAQIHMNEQDMIYFSYFDSLNDLFFIGQWENDELEIESIEVDPPHLNYNNGGDSNRTVEIDDFGRISVAYINIENQLNFHYFDGDNWQFSVVDEPVIDMKLALDPENGWPQLFYVKNYDLFHASWNLVDPISTFYLPIINH